MVKSADLAPIGCNLNGPVGDDKHTKCSIEFSVESQMLYDIPSVSGRFIITFVTCTTDSDIFDHRLSSWPTGMGMVGVYLVRLAPASGFGSKFYNNSQIRKAVRGI